MPRFPSQFMAAALAATFAVGSVVPVNAAPIIAPVDTNNSSGIIKVQQSRAVQEFTGDGVREWRRANRKWRRANRPSRREFRRERREFRRDRREFRQTRRDFRRGDITRREFRQARREFRGDRRDFRRDRRDFRRGFHRRGDWWYYNGYRGYRHYRPGWREYNGWWFPLAAFAAGAIVTGAIVDNDYGGNNWNAHVRWCYAKYRSYREWDNTYQPYHGPRRECYSPYS